MAPQVGLEPTTLRLTAGCSTIELLRSVAKPNSLLRLYRNFSPAVKAPVHVPVHVIDPDLDPCYTFVSCAPRNWRAQAIPAVPSRPA
jgi:hypothetical protein